MRKNREGRSAAAVMKELVAFIGPSLGLGIATAVTYLIAKNANIYVIAFLMILGAGLGGNGAKALNKWQDNKEKE